MFGHDNSQDKSDNKDEANTDSIWQPNNSQKSTSLPTDLPGPIPSSSPIPSTPPSDVVTPSSSTEEPSVTSNDLASIKQQALKQLGPLVGNLDQPPEEKFRTTMMMIQAADDQGLIKTAYEAAQAIPDEKIRAQALLDIVNEINYFSQKNENSK